MRYRFGGFALDADRFELRRGGERVPIEPKPLRFLLHPSLRTARSPQLPGT